MLKFCLYVLTPTLSFLGGFSAYVWILNNYWNQELGNDSTFVLVMGGTAYISLAIPLYFLMISFVDKRFNHFKFLLYPFMCMFVFFFPTVVIMLVWGGSDIFSAESMLFHAFFLTSGFIFGILNWLFKSFFIGNKSRKGEQVNHSPREDS